MLQCSGINLGLANLLSSSLGPATRGADAGLSLCLSTPPASPRNTIIPGAWCPWSQQGSPRAEMMSSTVRDFHSDIPRGDEISPSRGSSSFVPTPCSLLKLSASNPAVYFRRCQAVYLWLFMASDVFPFTAYFRCNKKRNKGAIKGKCSFLALSTLWDVSSRKNAACTPAQFALLLTGCSLCWLVFWAGFPSFQPAVHWGPDHRLQKEEMLELWLEAAAAKVQLLLWVLLHPSWARPASLSPCWKAWQELLIGKVLLIPELSVLLLKIGYSRKQAWSINLILMVYE